MHFAQVQWSEICEKWLINQIIIDTEVKGVLA